VAICEQMEYPRQAKGLVKREVVRVVTPGTVIEAEALRGKERNYLASVWCERRGCGLAYADASTGELAVTEWRGARAGEELLAELNRIDPAELLVPAGAYRTEGPGEERIWSAEYAALTEWARSSLPGQVVTERPAESFSHRRAVQTLTGHFAVATLAALGCQDLDLAVRAAGALLEYLQETQKSSLSHFTRLHTYWGRDYLGLDPATRRNLELVESLHWRERKGSLLWVLDETVTAMGGRLLRQWVERPLLSVAEIRRRLEWVAYLVERPEVREELRLHLRQVYDLERLIGRVGYNTANGRDLVALARSCAALPAVRSLLLASPAALLRQLGEEMDDLQDVKELIDRALVDDPPATVREGGLIRPGYDEEVDRLRESSRAAKEWIASLEAREREATGIKSLRVGFNKVFGYYLEVTRPNLHLVPERYQRRQTLANAERFITPELKEQEALVLGAEERIVEREYELFLAVRDAVAAAAPRIQATARAVAAVDVLAALAQVAVRWNYTRPEVDEGGEIEIEGGRHPVVERMMSEVPFVPNDCRLNHAEQEFILLTGPNMAGKSTYMRQVALIVLLAQMGSFVPAARARVGVVERIFTRVGAADDLASGQSTFLVEMSEMAYILRHATPRSLILLDEVGRGTSTFDGLSIAWAVVEFLQGGPGPHPFTLFATHYHELVPLVETLPQARNYQVAVASSEEGIVFLHRIVPGGADRSYGIEVARLAGLPWPVVERARQILAGLERSRPAGKPLGRGDRPAGVQQLSLFSPLRSFLEELAQVEVNRLTPLDALNLLADLVERARRLLGEEGERAAAGRREAAGGPRG
ncbi:MAG: DNA mismatch repair protein MutS, partial [Bacillota bacterium]|nr:DNA mismatch repair protein MutS [Bacillota bacterium]